MPLILHIFIEKNEKNLILCTISAEDVNFALKYQEFPEVG